MELHLKLLEVTKDSTFVELDTKNNLFEMYRQLVVTFLTVEVRGKKNF